MGMCLTLPTYGCPIQGMRSHTRVEGCVLGVGSVHNEDSFVTCGAVEEMPRELWKARVMALGTYVSIDIGGSLCVKEDGQGMRRGGVGRLREGECGDRLSPSSPSSSGSPGASEKLCLCGPLGVCSGRCQVGLGA